MAWLTSLLKKGEEAQAEILDEELPAEPQEPVPDGPQLAILVPDNAGISSFRVTMRPTAASAGEFIAAQRAEVRQETHAFWALQEKPIADEGIQLEALVLIRSQAESDLVYVVSFLDLESALSFTRFEVRRGLHLGNVMIYWAAFAQLREELDGVSVFPQSPPPVDYHLSAIQQEKLRPAAPVVGHAPEPVAVAPQPVIEEIPALEPTEETVEIEESLAPPLIQRRAEPAPQRAPEHVTRPPEPEPVAETLAPPVIERPAVLAPQPEPEAPAIAAPGNAGAEEDEDLGPLWPEAQQDAEGGEPADFDSATGEEQAAIEEAFVFQHRTAEFRRLGEPRKVLEEAGEANGMLVDHDEERLPLLLSVERSANHEVARLQANQELARRLAVAEPEPTVETVPGDEEVEFLPLAGLGGLGAPAARKLDDFDVAYEVERLLRHRKWEQRNGPFSGFRSPPGRF